MVILKQYISGLTATTNKQINKDVCIKNGVVFVNNGEYDYKYENESWFIKAGDIWVNMQGGIPMYTLEENLDESIFETIDAKRR